MEMQLQDIANLSEEDAVATIRDTDVPAYLLLDIIFNEPRRPVWDEAVSTYDPGKQIKRYRNYINFLSDQDKLLDIAIRTPSEEISQLAAAKLADDQLLQDAYERASDDSERERILRLVKDGRYIVDKLTDFTPEGVQRLFEGIIDAQTARHILENLPEDWAEARLLARRRFCKLSEEADLLDLIRDDSEDTDLRKAAAERLYNICQEQRRQNKRIRFKPGDSTIISGFACEELAAGKEGEDNPSMRLLSMHRICYKCGAKMNLNGISWTKPGVPYEDYYSTKRRFEIYLCPECGNEVYEQVEPWR